MERASQIDGLRARHKPRPPAPVPVWGPRSDELSRVPVKSVLRKPEYLEGEPKRTDTLTTGQCANALRVSIQTVIRAIDRGALKGHRVPDSAHRRVFVKDLVAV